MEFDVLYEGSKPIPISYLLGLRQGLPLRFIDILKEKNFYREEDFFEMVEKLYVEHTSNCVLPGKLVKFSPYIEEYVAVRNLTCQLSGARIKKGSIYYNYYAFMHVLDRSTFYRSKKIIRASLGYEHLFPRDLATYEDWYYRLRNAYYFIDENDIINFNILSVECGEDCLEPYLLGPRKRKVKENRKE